MNILKAITILIITLLSFDSAAANKRAMVQTIEPGFYILVSFSMSDHSLRKYFIEAESMGGKLIVKGLPGNKHNRNRFQAARARVEKAKINIDINPVIFEELGIKHVPTMIVVKEDGLIKKVSGHVSAGYALKVMQENKNPQFTRDQVGSRK